MAQVPGMTLAQVFPFLKEYYADQKIINELVREHPFHAMVPTDTEWSGESYPVPVAYGAAISYNGFSAAQGNQVSDLWAKFTATQVPGYTVVSMENAAIMASRNNMGAFVDALKFRIEAALDAQIRSDANQLWRSGTGTIGKVSANASGAITLTNQYDALYFQNGAVLVASTGDGSGTQAAGLGYVTSSDVSTGTITISDVPGGATKNPMNWDNTPTYPYLSLQSNFNTSISGVSAWVPPFGSSLRPTAGTALTFMGVNRALDPTRLAGVALDASGTNIESGLVRLCSSVRALGGSPEVVFMGTPSYQALTLEMQSRKAYIEQTVATEAGLEFSGIRVGRSTVIEDTDCPARVAYALTMKDWKYISYGPAAGVLLYKDNIEFFRETSSDSVEGRIGGYRQLICRAPGHQGVALLSA